MYRCRQPHLASARPKGKFIVHFLFFWGSYPRVSAALDNELGMGGSGNGDAEVWLLRSSRWQGRGIHSS